MYKKVPEILDFDAVGTAVDMLFLIGNCKAKVYVTLQWLSLTQHSLFNLRTCLRVVSNLKKPKKL